MFKPQIKQFIMAIIPINYFLWTQSFSGACLILLLMIILDTLTGIRAAYKNKNFSSSIARKRTFNKSLNYLTILIVGYLINIFFINLSIDGIVAEFMIAFIGGIIDNLFLVFIGFLIGVEGYSILENLAKMGQKIPKKIIKDWSNNLK